MNKKHGMILFSLVFLFFICLSSQAETVDEAGDDNTGRDDTLVYPIYDDVSLLSNIKYDYGKNPSLSVKSVYPQLQSFDQSAGIDHFNQLVMDIIQEEIDQFRRQALDNQALAQGHLGKHKSKNELYIDYDTSFLTANENHLISIRFTIQGYLARMAHPYHHHRVINFDIGNDQKIELNDLFQPGADYLSLLSAYASNKLARFKHIGDAQLLAAGTSPTAENYQNWNIRPEGLLFTFEEYQVAAYVYGAQTLLVPYSELKSVINPEAAISVCIDHPSRCSRNTLRTGGFMEEVVNTHHSALNPIFSKS